MIATLPPELTIAGADALKAALLDALARGEPVELDGRAVQEVDAAGLQVLCAARRSAAARGVPLAFQRDGRSPALVQAVELAGLAHHAREAWLLQEGE
jgi:anti-anti-sigma regulatory factor